MKILNVEFVKSIVSGETVEPGNVPEICFIGRSNVGKSSMINSLVGRKIARTSSSPGATKMINIFNAQGEWKGEKKPVIFSDFPGFGFSRVSRTVSQNWQAMIEGYILKNKRIKSIVWLFDIRRDIDRLDETLIEWLFVHNLEFCMVLTKCDKEGQGNIVKKRRSLTEYLQGKQVLVYSSKTGLGKKELLSYIAEVVA